MIQLTDIERLYFKNFLDHTILSFYHGSDVYGTKTELSDKDIFCVVSAGREAGLDYIWDYRDEENNIDYQFIGENVFKKMCKELHIIALEGVFLTDDMIIKGDMSEYKNIVLRNFDKWKLRQTISSICNNSWAKAHKKMTIEKDYDLYKAKKSLFHCLRLFDFGKQIAENKSIVNYHSCVDLWKEIYEDESTDWEHYKKKYKPIYNRMRSAMVALCPMPEEPVSPIEWIVKSNEKCKTDNALKTRKDKFDELHKELVDKIIRFCKENGINNAFSFDLYADGVNDSISFGYWTPSTDSSFSLHDSNRNCIMASL